VPVLRNLHLLREAGLLPSGVALKGLSTAKKVGLWIATAFYITAGTLHFVKPGAYLRIMPPFIPWPLAMVLTSGILEILGGVGLLVPRVRRQAAWSLVALLIAVFPANIYMATNPIEAGAASITPVLRWGRLPLQVLLIWWLLWCTRPRAVLR
jgi:uncharacterized membrane protein